MTDPNITINLNVHADADVQNVKDIFANEIIPEMAASIKRCAETRRYLTPRGVYISPSNVVHDGDEEESTANELARKQGDQIRELKAQNEELHKVNFELRRQLAESKSTVRRVQRALEGR